MAFRRRFQSIPPCRYKLRSHDHTVPCCHTDTDGDNQDQTYPMGTSDGSVFQCNQPHSCTGPSQHHNCRLRFYSHMILHILPPSDRHHRLSCSCVQSSQERRYTAHSQDHSEHCSRTHTSFGICDQSVHSGMSSGRICL